ncbi:hypothetical protein [Brevibacillus laterosporus]|uniref:hypothetical protein n=1 Tax=Brevibacillus laterosporus TaxID=1465 RepID=UPI00215CB2B0|nr:hypothetical protein [Brevibacillus laterosporus]MCR8994605.1 hypothetical protein [Brevibacillus laterosporus]
MKTTEFNERTRNLYNYFTNREKWKENNEGDFIYYKGKRNLIELKFILELVFGDRLKIISKSYFRNNDNKIIGGSIIGKIYVDADFNGLHQGTKGADVFVSFILTENAYFRNQSSTLKGVVD